MEDGPNVHHVPPMSGTSAHRDLPRRLQYMSSTTINPLIATLKTAEQRTII